MNQLDEQIARKSIIGILNSSNDVIGTGFFVTSGGHALTCFHVIETLEKISVKDFDNNVYEAELDKEKSIPDCDLAVLKVSPAHADHLMLTSSFAIGDEVWSSGYHFYGKNIKAPLPVLGKIDGTTSILFGNNKEYSLNNVLKIGDAKIEEGISGGPVILLKENRVIGLTNAKFGVGGGFSLPLKEAATHSQSFSAFIQSIIDADAKEKQEHEQLLKEELVRLQVRNSLNRLIDTEQYLPGYIEKRENVMDELESFIEDTHKIFVLVGNSGVGKTSLLAYIADQQPKEYLTVFLSAYQFSVSVDGLEGELKKEFAYLLDQQKEARVSIDALMEIFSDPEKPVTIIIDGFNEIPNSAGANLRNWIDKTTAWIKNRSVKVILSTRPEIWGNFEGNFPKGLIYPGKREEENKSADGKKKDSENRQIVLNDFTDEELSRARELYKIPTSILSNRSLRHPLLLRVIWSLHESNNLSKGAGNYVLFLKFIQNKCTSIAANSANPTYSKDAVYSALLMVGKKMRETKSSALALTEYFLLFQNTLGDNLINEAVLTRSDTEVRFVFDQVGEFLASETMELDSSKTNWTKLWKNIDYYDRTILPWAIAKLEYKNTEISNLLLGLINIIEESKSTSLLAVLNNIILTCERPYDYLPMIEDLYTQLSEATRRSAVEFELSILINNLHIEFTDKLELIRICLQYEHYYEWEQKHWVNLSYDSFIRTNFSQFVGVTGLLKSEILANPATCFKAIVPWLNDKTPLSSDQDLSSVAHINDIACAIFFHFRNLDLNLVCSLLVDEADKGVDTAWSCLRSIAEKDPDQILPFIKDWNNKGVHPFVVARLSNLFLTTSDKYYNDLSPIALKNIAATDDISIKNSYATALIKYPAHRKEMMELILPLAASVPSLIYGISTYLAENFDSVFPVIDQYIMEPGRDRNVDSLLHVLYGEKYEAKHQDLLADKLETYFHHFKGNEEFHYMLAYTFESFGYRVETNSSAYKKLLALFRPFIETINYKVQGPLFYFLTDFKNKDRLADQLELIEYVLKLPESQFNRRRFIEITTKAALIHLTNGETISILKKMLLNEAWRKEVSPIISELTFSMEKNGIEVLRMLTEDFDTYDPDLMEFGYIRLFMKEDGLSLEKAAEKVLFDRRYQSR